MTGSPQQIEGLIAPQLAALGYEVVQVRLLPGQPATLQVLAEPVSGAAMTVADCAAVSRQVSVALDAADPVAGKYLLEVSSPGVDRPLVKPADFDRFRGREAKIETRDPVDGRRRFRGRLEGIDDGLVAVRLAGEGEQPGERVALPFDSIATAKLALPPDLLQRRSSAATK